MSVKKNLDNSNSVDSEGLKPRESSTGDPGEPGEPRSDGSGTASDGSGTASDGDNSSNGGDRDISSGEPGSTDKSDRGFTNPNSRGRKTNLFGFGKPASPIKQPLTDEERRERDRERKRLERERKRAEQQETRTSDSGESGGDTQDNRESTQEESEPVHEIPPRRVNYKDLLDSVEVDDHGLPKGVIAGAFKALFALPAMGGLGEHWRISDRDAKDLAEGLSNALQTIPRAQRGKYDKFLKNYFPWLMFAGGIGLLVEERLSKTLEIKRMEAEFASQGSVFEQGNTATYNPSSSGSNNPEADAGGNRKAAANKIFRRF